MASLTTVFLSIIFLQMLWRFLSSPWSNSISRSYILWTRSPEDSGPSASWFIMRMPYWQTSISQLFFRVQLGRISLLHRRWLGEASSSNWKMLLQSFFTATMLSAATPLKNSSRVLPSERTRTVRSSADCPYAIIIELLKREMSRSHTLSQRALYLSEVFSRQKRSVAAMTAFLERIASSEMAMRRRAYSVFYSKPRLAKFSFSSIEFTVLLTPWLSSWVREAGSGSLQVRRCRRKFWRGLRARIPFLIQSKNGMQAPTKYISDLKIFQMEIEEKKDHAQELKELDDKIADAELNFGDIEVRDAILAKAHFVRRTLDDKDEAIKIYQLALKKTIEIGKKMDINFEILRIHLENRDIDKVKDIIDDCKVLFEKGGDWERKNKLKVYQAVYLLVVRDFQTANELFVSAIPTFNAPEVMTYEDLIFYTVMTGVIFMSRADLKKKIIESPEATVQLQKMKDLNEYLTSFYSCNYKRLYQKLVWVMDAIKADKYLSLHYRYFMRETRIVIYSQFLESYKTVKLETMAREFGVSVEFIDKEVATAIDIKRLNCKIDKVAGIIESERTDKRNNFYKSALKKGDHLLNRIQKLSRIIDV